MKTYFITILLLILLGNYKVFGDYYWREYSGVVPHDAIIGGRSHNDLNVYIGQVYIKNMGIMVAEIFNGTSEVEVAITGVRKADKYIKILCGQQDKIKWLISSSKTLHLDTIGKHMILGGHEDGLGIIYIGRLNIEGSVKIGKVNSFRYEDARFHFVQNHEEKGLLKYAVLYLDNDIESS